VNLPVAVLRKRFLPPLWFFNFGILYTSCLMCPYLSYLRQEPVRPERSHCKKDLKICSRFLRLHLRNKRHGHTVTQ
jgi:hypothetical protein